MNSLEILKALQDLPAQTRGVFPADRIPNRWSRPAAIVANTDDHTKPGKHWVAIYVDENGHGIYFDSYGLPPLISHHYNRLRRNCRTLEWNTKPLQALKSRVCGEYCISFLDCMCRGITLATFCRYFTSNKMKNDTIVARYYRKKMLHNKKRHTRKYVSQDNVKKGYGIMRSKCIQSCVPRFGVYV